MIEHPQNEQVLSVNLTADHEDQPFEFSHIELRGRAMRQRIIPSKSEHRLEVLFDPSFVAFIRDCLLRADGSTIVLSDVDASFRTETLSLGQLQMMRTVRPDCTRKAVLRFLRVAGDVQSLFRSKQTPTQAETRAIALEAIEGVVGRSYDVARVYETVRGFSEPQGQFDGCSREIMSKREELLFRLDLLQRAVERNVARTPDADRPERLSLVRA